MGKQRKKWFNFSVLSLSNAPVSQPYQIFPVNLLAGNPLLPSPVTLKTEPASGVSWRSSDVSPCAEHVT